MEPNSTEESMDVTSSTTPPTKVDSRRVEIQAKFEEICQSLNLDEQAKTCAWDAYVDLSDKYGLEEQNRPTHWLACALYVACRTTKVETVSGEETMGSNVPLTRILKEADISLLKFFTCIKNWAEMAHLDSTFHAKIHAVERNYEVASVVFNKYYKEFVDIFNEPEKRQLFMKQQKQRKVSRVRNPTTADLFDFGWMLYIFIKGQYPQISDDLVNSHHLLLCCVDMLYNAVLLGDKMDMINMESLKNVLPPNFQSDDYVPPVSVQSILGVLCKRHSGIEAECRTMSKYKWWPKVKELYDKGIFISSGSSAEGYKDEASLLLSKFMIPNVFSKNFKGISREYEVYMLHEGEFDERMFLSGNAEEEIGTPSKSESWGLVSYPSPAQPQTPLTNRHHLECRTDVKATPVSKHTQLVNKLHLLLTETNEQPSKYIMDMASTCPQNPLPSIKSRLKVLGEKFLVGLSELPLTDSSKVPNSSEDRSTAQTHLSFAVTLYYRFLEAVLRGEEAKSPGSSTAAPVQVQEMLEHDYLQSSLFACAVEIILCAHKSNRVFPWVIDIMEIQPFHFYKILEPVIKEEPGLTREMVKYLGQIEEMVLEQLAWKSDSPLFDAIDVGKVPTYEEVSADFTSPPPGRPQLPPFTNPRVHHLGAKDTIGSPLSARDRYASPVPRDSVAVRRLFEPKKEPEPPMAVEQTRVADHSSPNPSEEKKPLPEQTQAGVPPSAAFVTPKKPGSQKRMGSLELFYRKVYFLAYIRLKDLCERLSISEDSLKKIWTTFEYSMTKCPEIMRDRHLDQLIMCAIYVMSKVLRLNVTFQEIMRQYRHQPQAKSHVYRSVLLNNGKREVPIPDSPSGDLPRISSRARSTSTSLPQSPGEAEPVLPSERRLSSSSSSTMKEGERGDIINFYNKVYISYIKEFALKFQQNGVDDKSLQLSPMPVYRKPPPSPRQLSKHQNIFVSPHKLAVSPLASSRKYEYTLQKSPRKDLHVINNALSGSKREGHLSKRKLFSSSAPTSQDSRVPPAKRLPVPPSGVCTTPEKTSFLGDIISTSPRASFPPHIPLASRLPMPQIPLSVSSLPAALSLSPNSSTATQIKPLRPPNAPVSVFDLQLSASVATTTSSMQGLQQRGPAVTTHQ